MYNNKIFIIVFMYLAVVCIVKEASANKKSHKDNNDEGPCDSCPRQGKCVPKVCCPAHVRPGSNNPECHLKDGQIGVCCYTGQRHAAENEKKSSSKEKSSEKKGLSNDLKNKLSKNSKETWKKLSQKSKKLLDTCKDVVVSSNSTEYGLRLSNGRAENNKTEELGEGAMLNLIATQEQKKRDAIDDEDLTLGYGDKGPYCPPIPVCPDPPSSFRSINGECNNPDNPTWGAANTRYGRLLAPDYSDCIFAIRTSKCNPGEPLPSARAISAALMPDGDYPNDECNLLAMQTGQFYTHDLTSAVIVTIGNGSSISCIKDGACLPPEQQHWACAPIPVAPDDKFYSSFGTTCLNFVRAQPAPAPDCSCGYATPMNGATHFFDLSQLYGSNEAKQNELRASGGKLKTYDNYGQELPPQTDQPVCLIPSQNGACFLTGDGKGNQFTPLTCMHTLFTREHNRIVDELLKCNPGCNEDILFNNAKRILVAMWQHIFTDWLRLFIGPKRMKEFDLDPCEGYSNAYDPEVNPSITVEFAGAAFRLHSAVTDHLHILDPRTGNTSDFIRSSEQMFNPSMLILQELYDSFMLMMSSQPMQNIDPIITTALTQLLFHASKPFGSDMASLNVQRGRDFGIRPYNDYRELCGLPRIKDFKGFPGKSGKKLAKIYACVDDVDLWVGGLMEKPCDGAQVGPTFSCIIAEQASRSKKGDRYHYANGPEYNPLAFSLRELAEIKKANMARIICDNSDKLLTSMPRDAFRRRDLPDNPPIPCYDSRIPSMDLCVFKLIE